MNNELNRQPRQEKPMKMALMIIDLQKAYQNERNEKYMLAACEYINAVIPVFRNKKLPVFWVQHKNDGDGALPGKRGFDFIDDLKPDPKDIRIVKEYGNAFNKTECLTLLQKRGIDTVLITGFSAEYCVLSTYRGALDLDLTPIILQNSLASDNREAIDFVEKISNIASYPVIMKMLE